MGVQPHGRGQSGKRCLAALKNALGTLSCSTRDSRSGPCARHRPWGAAAVQRFTEPPRPAEARIQHRFPRGQAGLQLPVGDNRSQTLKVPRKGSTWMGLPSCEKGLPGGLPWPSTALRAAAPSLGEADTREPTAFWKGHCHCEHLLDAGSPSQPSLHGRRRHEPAQGSVPPASAHPQPKPGVGPSPAPSAHHSSGRCGSGWGWAAEARSPRPVPPPPCRLPSALCAAYQVTGAGSCVHA